MNKEKVLGFDVCTGSPKEMLENIFKSYKKQEQLFIVNINPEIIIANYNNEKFKEILNEQKYQIPDGTGIVWASKKNKGNIKQRITGIDLMIDICEKSQGYNARIFLYGSKPGIATLAKENLKNKFPKINIVGECNGYCDEKEVIYKIIESNADIVFVGIGSPKQENFIIENKEKFPSVKIFMPVGGSFDVISKTKKRAPNWVIKCNLEWLYRFFQEPSRIGRQMKLLKFMYLVRREKNGKN